MFAGHKTREIYCNRVKVKEIEMIARNSTVTVCLKFNFKTRLQRLRREIYEYIWITYRTVLGSARLDSVANGQSKFQRCFRSRLKYRFQIFSSVRLHTRKQRHSA